MRRHFNGQKQFPCLKCNKKSFAVREDLTMHMKSCGNVSVEISRAAQHLGEVG